MSNESTIPSQGSKSVCTFTILSEGNPVSQSWHVLTVVVSKEVNRIPSATIILLDGEASRETFEISNEPDFEPGKKIEVKAGYSNAEETIFKGMVVKHSIKVRKKSTVLVIEARDEAVKMTTHAKSKYYKEVKDSDVLEELIGRYGLQKDVTATSITHKEIVQYDATDWDFMLCRADVNGMLCTVSDGKVQVARPDFAQATALTIQYGATVLDLDAEIDARLQYKSIKATAWDPAGQALVNGVEATDPGIPEAGNLTPSTLANVTGAEALQLQHGGAVKEPELKAWASAKWLKQQLGKIRGRVRIDGTSDVQPGKLVQLNGVGERFQGKLFVSGVQHQIEKGNWETVIQFGMSPEWFAETYTLQSSLAGAMLPAIQGLQTGIATRLEGDPEGEDRIMVRLPLIHAQDEGIWARICTLDAGANRGTFFRPEINDEVIVGFINNDPRHAIILGMCNSSAKPAPLPAADDNHEKGYVSRSEMKVIFNDDKKTIVIATPAGNKMTLTEEDKAIQLEDQHGNKIIMNEDGIKLESSKDIVLKATRDIKAEGVNMELKSSAQLKAEGGAGAEVSSGGSTKVKGAIVQIN